MDKSHNYNMKSMDTDYDNSNRDNQEETINRIFIENYKKKIQQDHEAMQMFNEADEKWNVIKSKTEIKQNLDSNKQEQQDQMSEKKSIERSDRM